MLLSFISEIYLLITGSLIITNNVENTNSDLDISHNLLFIDRVNFIHDRVQQTILASGFPNIARRVTYTIVINLTALSGH